VLWHAHRDPDNLIDLRYVLLDGTLRPPRVTAAKWWANLGYAVAIWAFIWITVRDKMTWEMFAAFMAGVVGTKVLGDMNSLKERAMTDATINDEARSILKG
jgi:hypothetical protein